MISKRPFSIDYCADELAIKDGDGRIIFESRQAEQGTDDSGDTVFGLEIVTSDDPTDDFVHMADCVNAIHAAGIRPEDVAVFVEAVRAWDGWDGNDTKDQRAEREKAMDKATALLPEARTNG